MARLPHKFHRAFCEGHSDANGFWQADGRGPRAETELKRRLGVLMIKHAREKIWADTPAKTRQIIRLDVGGQDDPNSIVQKARSETHMFKALEQTLALKKDDIVENVINGLGSGEKCTVWVLTRESVEIMAEAIEKATEARENAPLMRQERVKVWATHGEASVKVRNRTAEDFVAHKGAGVIIATMDSLPESVSLYGATVEHYAQLHFLAGPMVQSENRPYLKGTSKLHIIYYIAKGSIDERIERLILPRVETMAKLMDEGDAIAVQKLFAKKKETFEEFVARLTANTLEDGQALVDGISDDDPEE